MSNLYEVLLGISKQECDGDLRNVYKQHIEEIFQNERIKYDFEKKTFVIKDPQFDSIKSTIQLFRRFSDEEKNEYIKNSQDNKDSTNKEKDKEKEKEKNVLNQKINFCALNKEKLYSNITFYDSIGKFLENSIYFIKYISNKKIDSILGDTKIIEVARCGYNMENILKDLGYKESKSNIELGFFYQYKYYPIICIYQIIKQSKNIFLQIKGYYNDNTKDEILEKLKIIVKQLSELFVIK